MCFDTHFLKRCRGAIFLGVRWNFYTEWDLQNDLSDQLHFSLSSPSAARVFLKLNCYTFDEPVCLSHTLSCSRVRPLNPPGDRAVGQKNPLDRSQPSTSLHLPPPSPAATDWAEGGGCAQPAWWGGGYVLLMNTHAAERAYLSAHIWHRRCESTRLDGACLSGQLTIRLHLRARR